MSDEKGQVRPSDELDAEAAARRRLALQHIRQYPDPALRLTAKPVERFDGDLDRLVTRMTGLMGDANGIGLAATQVGILQRIFVFRLSRNENDENHEETLAIANPEIVERSSETEVDEEGCLSLQGILVPVERHVGVTIVGSDASGNDVRHELEGLPARVVQHELDHLDGVLILDRTDDASRREALATLRPRLAAG